MERKWDIRDNVQLCQLYKTENVVQIIGGTKIERIIHTQQADVSMFKRVITYYIILKGKKPREKLWKRQKGSVKKLRKNLNELETGKKKKYIYLYTR